MAVVILSVWGALALFSLVDLQTWRQVVLQHHRAFDYSVRTQFIHAISSTGIPPANPFFFPGHGEPLRYHYFWLILCSMVDVAGGAFVGPRHAWIGGAIWCGAGFLALIALFFRLVAYQGPETFRRRTLIGILLLGVTGPRYSAQRSAMGDVFEGIDARFIPPVEWWNEQVDGFTCTALWEAHHLAGLVACLMAFLLLWEAPRHTGAGAVEICGCGWNRAGFFRGHVDLYRLRVWSFSAVVDGGRGCEEMARRDGGAGRGGRSLRSLGAALSGEHDWRRGLGRRRFPIRIPRAPLLLRGQHTCRAGARPGMASGVGEWRDCCR